MAITGIGPEAQTRPQLAAFAKQSRPALRRGRGQLRLRLE
jgi:hypothetical protein